MSDNDFFRNNDQELQRLTKDIAELKSTMRDIASSLSRIERHVKRSFAIPPKSKFSIKSNTRQENTIRKKDVPTITAEDALRIFDQLSESWEKQEQALIKEKLQAMILPNLKLIAHELGLTFKGKPSKKKLCEGIIGRLNERSMLSKNINISSSSSSMSILKK